MAKQGSKPEQGQTYALAFTYARSLDLAHLRQLSQAITTEIISRKTLRASKTKKRE